MSQFSGSPPSGFNSDIPPGIADIILKCLAKKPEERYRNVPELIAAIEGVLTPNPSDAKIFSWASDDIDAPLPKGLVGTSSKKKNR